MQQASQDEAKLIAGGTNLLDLMKLEIEKPAKLVDINGLALDQIEATSDGGMRIGALVTNSDLANHPRIRQDYAVLSRAILAGASGQLRNKATTGGNLLQRTRCHYFYQPDSACNKRKPGSGCPAIGGENRGLAILGVSDHCIAQHPSDMAVAMRLLDARVETRLPDGGSRQIPLVDFYCLPGDTPHIETVLQPGELITHVVLPAPPTGRHDYVKVRDRASYAFALVSIASVIEVQNGQLAAIRMAFGGIGVQPWRNEAAEAILLGSTGDSATIDQAADLLLCAAQPQTQNLFKVSLTRRLIHQAVQQALTRAGVAA